MDEWPGVKYDRMVTLSSLEIREGAILGIDRRIDCIKKDIKQRVVRGDERPELWWGQDIEAELAQKVVAKYGNFYYEPRVGDLQCQDIGKHIGVRHSLCDTAHLRILPNDKPGLFVLVTGSAPRYRVAGCFSSFIAKKTYPLGLGPTSKGAPAHWVPQGDLHPFPPRRMWMHRKNPLVLFLEPEYWNGRELTA